MPHDSTSCPACANRPEGTMSDAAFDDFLSLCRTELQQKQADFAQWALKGNAYAWDLDKGTFVVESRQLTASLIGSYCLSRRTWLWGWANDSFSTKVREQSAKLKGLYDITGFRVFLNEGIHASKQDAEDFAAMAVHFNDGIAFWRSIEPDRELYLCLGLKDPSFLACVSRWIRLCGFPSLRENREGSRTAPS